ncbi:MAG: hypothetical protein KAR56_00085 [Thermoplasmata archaeon]|nr:hypothetical protein [Thermoplasmata archaeon]
MFDHEGGSKMNIRRHPNWNDEGVASTVGTIMALMVFLAFLSMFTSQYVPVWMEENEATHMNTVYSQFANLKQSVDIQVQAGLILGSSQVQIFSPIKLGANGIPMFAAPTPGYLSIHRSSSYDYVNFSFGAPTSVVNFNSTTDYESNTGGTISMYAPNRYYVKQELAYENGAIILKQPDGEYMKASPQFRVNPSGAFYQISYTQLDIRGDDSSYVGYGTRGIQTTLKAASTTTFTNLTNGTHPYLYINHTTWYEGAWNSSFNQTLTHAGMEYGTPAQLAAGTANYTIVSTLVETDLIDSFYQVSVRINPLIVSRFSLTEAYLEVTTTEMGAN